MTIQRMDNVLINVEDMDAVKGFLLELGMEVEGETTVEGPWVDKVIGLAGAKSDICVLRTPDGHGKIELAKFHAPKAVDIGQGGAPANALGIRRVMFAVEDVDDAVRRLRAKHGAELVGEIVDFGDTYRLCYVRGPEGIVFGLAEELK